VYHSANAEISKDKVYLRVSLGGTEQMPAGYALETKTYFKLGPLEIFRGLLNYSISIVSKYGTLDLMRAHEQSFSPGRVHLILYLNLRLLRRNIKRRICDVRRASEHAGMAGGPR
jgi:hypothetical protein